MPNTTNKEWIDNNNLKIDDLITQASELPDYQDIEPIYGVKQLIENKINIQYDTSYKSIEYMGNYIGVLYSYNTRNQNYTIYKVNDNNTLTQLYRVNATDSYFYTYLIDYDSDYVYFYQDNRFSSTSTLPIYRVPVSGGSASLYWNISVSSGAQSSFGVIKKGQIVWNDYVYNVNCTNKTINKTNTNITNPYSFVSFSYSSCVLLNYNMVYNFNSSGVGTKLTRIDTGVSRSSNINNVNAVLYDNMKIVIANNLYYLNEDLTTGELIKENVISGYTANMMLTYIYETYYLSLKDGKIYFFNVDTNMFELYKTVTKLSKTNCPLRARAYTDGAYYYLIAPELSSKVIGYNCYGEKLYLPAYSFGNSSNLLTGNVLYNKFGTIISGTMPNNGALNYTPTTSQQTIPAGYTSGGTIGAVSMTEQEIQEAEDIISDLFGEGENE